MKKLPSLNNEAVSQIKAENDGVGNGIGDIIELRTILTGACSPDLLANADKTGGSKMKHGAWRNDNQKLRIDINPWPKRQENPRTDENCKNYL